MRIAIDVLFDADIADFQDDRLEVIFERCDALELLQFGELVASDFFLC